GVRGKRPNLSKAIHPGRKSSPPRMRGQSSGHVAEHMSDPWLRFGARAHHSRPTSLKPPAAARSAESGGRQSVPAPSGQATEWGEQDSNLRRLSHQIYSLVPLTARESPRSGRGDDSRAGSNSRFSARGRLRSTSNSAYFRPQGLGRVLQALRF